MKLDAFVRGLVFAPRWVSWEIVLEGLSIGVGRVDGFVWFKG